jgi:hypothetical protein
MYIHTIPKVHSANFDRKSDYPELYFFWLSLEEYKNVENVFIESLKERD